mgnify:CR=1 FL=1
MTLKRNFITTTISSFIIALMGCAQTQTLDIENVASSLDEQAYLILNLDQNSNLINKIALHNIEQNIDYELVIENRTGTSLVLSVPAGSYYLRKVTTQYQDAMAIRLSEPPQPLTFKEDNLYYLGNISLDINKLYVNFTKEAIGIAMKRNPEAFKGRELFVFNHLLGDSKTASLKIPRVPGAGASAERQCASCSE